MRRGNPGGIYRRKAPMAKATHPAIIDTPPTGTTAPSQFQDGPAKVSTFSSPEKRMMPIRNAQAANRHALFGRCSERQACEH